MVVYTYINGTITESIIASTNIPIIIFENNFFDLFELKLII